MLSDLPRVSDARVLVDYQTADDAGVYALNDTEALVQTVDFFTPIVDDPFVYGEIAAANALSDVYAMGGRPLTALAIAAFPARDFAAEDIRAVFAGGLAGLQAAGVVLLGGHTVQDVEVKFGYAVTGLVDPRRMWTNASARVGDVLLLTKSLGTGIITTAIKADRAPAAAASAAIASMRQLNKGASEALREAGHGVVSACTDVTGFGLAGHASEMAAASGVVLSIALDRLPLLPGAPELADEFRPGGSRTNQSHFGKQLGQGVTLSSAQEAMVFDPQTSGGLLVAVAPAEAGALMAKLARRGSAATAIGRVHPAAGRGSVVFE